MDEGAPQKVRFHLINDKILEETKMRKIRYEFLLIAGLIMTLGCATVFANDRDKVKRPKNSGILTVKTDEAYTVKINGVRAGMSGVNEPAVFYLTPDVYTVEIEGKDGKILWADTDVDIRKNRKHCICLKTIRTDEKVCPYDVHLEGSPLRVKPGQEVRIRAVDSMGYTGLLNYDWSISAGTISSGHGTSSITIDTTGLRGGVIDVRARVNDGKWPQCEQPMTITVEIEPEIVKPELVKCDEFDELKPDDLKARLDNCVIQVQATPDAKLYIVIFPKPDRRGNTDAAFQRQYKIISQYLINQKGLSNFEIVKGRERSNTRIVIWIFPPGADYPPLY